MPETRIEAITEAIEIIHGIKHSIPYLKKEKENEHYFAGAEDHIKHAEDYLTKLLREGTFDAGKINEAISHIAKIKALISRLYAIIDKKNNTLTKEIEEYKQSLTTLSNFFELLRRSNMDFDTHIGSLHQAIKNVTDISAYLHNFEGLQKLIDREAGDLVDTVEQNISDTSQIQHEVTALKHIEDELKKTMEHMISSGHPPTSEIEHELSEGINKTEQLRQRVNSSKMNETREARREYYTILREYKEARKQQTDMSQKFNQLKAQTKMYQEPVNNGLKTASKNKLEKNTLIDMGNFAQKEINAERKLIQDLEKVRNITDPAIAQETQEIENLALEIEKHLRKILQLEATQ
jgi:chromosome segregation ATPase